MRMKKLKNEILLLMLREAFNFRDQQKLFEGQFEKNFQNFEHIDSTTEKLKIDFSKLFPKTNVLTFSTERVQKFFHHIKH